MVAALERLEKSSSESKQLIEQLYVTFGNMLVNPPAALGVGEPSDQPERVGSLLGKTLMGFADQIEDSNNQIRELINRADI